METPMSWSSWTLSLALRLICCSILLAPISGCVTHPTFVPIAQQTTIDRSLVEYPTGYELKPYIRYLTAPTAIAFDNEGSLLVAEGGLGGNDTSIIGFKP